MTGMLISFEGGECSGKDSQIKLLEKRLLTINSDYKILSSIQEPGSTLKAEIIRMMTKNKHDTEFVFPGDFLKTFDFNKYKSFFEKEVVPLRAIEYLTLTLMNMSEGVKTETLSFIMNNSFKNKSFLERLITELNKNPHSEKNTKDIILGEYFNKEILSPEAQLYIHLAARNMLYTNVVRPAMDQYDFIIMNRSLDSSAVYQGHAQESFLFNKIENIRSLNKEAIVGKAPDITILLDLPVEEIYKRKASRKIERGDKEYTKDFFDEKEQSFHEKVREGYLKEAEYYSSLNPSDPEYERMRVIDATGSISEVHEKIWSEIHAALRKAA